MQTVSADFEARLQQKVSARTLREFAQNDSSLLSPYLYKICGVPIFYASSLDKSFSLENSVTAPLCNGNLQDRSTLFADDITLVDYSDELLLATYISNPKEFKYSNWHYENENVPVSDGDDAKPTGTEVLFPLLTDFGGNVKVEDIAPDVEVGFEQKKPNFWTKSGKISTQFSQNYFSSNWHKGGDNNMALLSQFVFEASYNDQRYVQWDNKIDLRLGFNATPSDTVNAIIPTNDKIYIYSKLGIKAVKSWYYAISLEANTQFLNGKRRNDPKIYSSFMAPFEMFVSVGMDYKPTFKSGNTLSIVMQPLSYRLKYLGSDDPTICSSYNMDAYATKNEFGSRVDLNTKINILKNFYWKSRFYYYTTYKNIESEWENVLSYSFSRYFSAEVTALWRYDDSRNKKYYDSDLGFFQFKEFFTLGFVYGF